MSNYTKSTNFASKDSLSSGNPLKIVKGTEIDTEFNNIAIAVATKTDNASAAITGGVIDNTVIGGTTAAAGSFTTVTASGNVTLNGGTANGVVYLNGSKVLTTGNALAFDGTNLGIGTNSPQAHVDVSGSGDQFVRASSSTNTAFRGFEFGLTGSSQSYGSLAMELNGGEVRLSAGFTGWGGFQTFYLNGSERARIDSSGNLLVGNTSATATPSTGFVFYPAASGVAAQMFIGHASGTGSGSAYEGYVYNGTQIGSVTQNGTTAVAYNTTSDYRLKDNQQPLTGSGAFIDALQPKTWEWKADGSKGVGFIAHEVQAVSPGSVVGEKDAVDEEGKPKYQAMEYGSAEFIANIVAELQSLRARVAQLEAK